MKKHSKLNNPYLINVDKSNISIVVIYQEI